MTTIANLLFHKGEKGHETLAQISAMIAPHVEQSPAPVKVRHSKIKRTEQGIAVRLSYMREIRRRARILKIRERGTQGFCALVNAAWAEHLTYSHLNDSGEETEQ
jgi:hypothetical protein